MPVMLVPAARPTGGLPRCGLGLPWHWHASQNETDSMSRLRLGLSCYYTGNLNMPGSASDSMIPAPHWQLQL